MKSLHTITHLILACLLFYSVSCTTREKKIWAGPFSFMVKEWHPYYMEKANKYHVEVGLAKREGDHIDEKVGRDKRAWPLFDQAQYANYYFDSWRESEYYAKTQRVVDAYKEGEINKTQAQLMIDQYKNMHKLAFEAEERVNERNRRDRIAERQRKNEQFNRAVNATWDNVETQNDPEASQSDKNRAFRETVRNPF